MSRRPKQMAGLMPRFTVSWSLTIEASDAVEAAAAAWRAAFLDSHRTQATLVKVTDAIGCDTQIIDWATHAVCGTPQPELTPVYKHPERVDLSLLRRCQTCGSWDVQLSYPAWHAPNEGYKYVSTDEEADHIYEWCNHCEANMDIVTADEWVAEVVLPQYRAHATFWSAHPPGSAPVYYNPEEIPE